MRGRSNASNAQELIAISRLVTCKRCGESELAWSQSTVTGKWFLCPTTDRKLWSDPNGDRDPSAPRGFRVVVKLRPHRCGESAARAAKQAAQDAEYRASLEAQDGASWLVRIAQRLMEQQNKASANVVIQCWLDNFSDAERISTRGLDKLANTLVEAHNASV